MYEKTETTCQPCEYFDPDEGHSLFGYKEHQCPLCSGWRVFCLNCYKDHHRDGWNTCVPPAFCKTGLCTKGEEALGIGDA